LRAVDTLVFISSDGEAVRALRHHQNLIAAAADCGVTHVVALMPITYVDLAPAEYSMELARAGEEPWWQYAYSALFDSVRQHRWRLVSGEVSRLTGRSAEPAGEMLSRPGG
jgi:hypothetical protein